MNKKFFTLIASVFVLAGLVGSASAVGITRGDAIPNLPKTDGGRFIYQIGIHVGGDKGDTPDKLLSIDSKGILHLDEYTAYDRPYGESLWCVDFSDWNFDGSYGAGLLFTNRASQKPLMASVEDSKFVSADDSINVTLGELFTWGLSAVYGQNIEQGMPLYSYFTEDSVIVFCFDNNATGGNTATLPGAGFYTARIAANDFFAGVQSGTWSSDFYTNDPAGAGADKSGDLLYATIEKPKPIILTANDFNTLIGTKKESASSPNYNKLTFTQDSVNVKWYNPWSAFELHAEDVAAARITAVSSTATNAAATNWLQFNLKNSLNPSKQNNKWLHVDTVYSDQKTKYLTFNFGQNPIPASGTNLLEGQYYFRLAYNVYNDSLGIDVLQARYVTNDPAAPKSEKWFDESVNSTVKVYTWDGYSDGTGNHDELFFSNPANDPAINAANGWADADYLHVGLVDIDGNKTRLITLRTPPVFTYAKLGLSGCRNENTFDSIEEGLYVILNGGLALGVPINTDSAIWQQSHYPPVFTNLYGIQDPQQMPSYQWVVKKLRKSRPELSPIQIINREFPNIVYQPVQLLQKNENVKIEGANLTINKSFFKKVETKYSSDKYLGYFYIDDRTARLNSYDLNYLHNFDAERYLGVGSVAEKAKGLAIQSSPFQWTLDPVKKNPTDPSTPSVAYGYTPTQSDIDDLKIAQLERVAYTIMPNTTNVLSIDDQKTYVSTKSTDVTTSAGVGDYGVFLIKTHNTKDGKNYYALLDTNSFYGRYIDWDSDPDNVVYNHVGERDYPASTTPLNLSYTKVGIADGSVVAYAQPQREVRTSAFHIGVYHAPLYRRFDGGEYTYGNGPAKIKEPHAGDDANDSNSPLFLKFHDIIQDWMYLYENSDASNKFQIANKGISFLGLQDKVHFPEGSDIAKKAYYEFYVDTAFVKRTANGEGGPDVKPEDYTPMPQYMLALRPFIMKEGKVWYKEGNDTFWGDTPPDHNDPQWQDWKEKSVSGLTRGYYLFNAADSVSKGNSDYKGTITDNIENDTRLAFVDGVHYGDTFYVISGLYSYDSVSTFLIQREPERLYNLPWYKKHYLGENTHFVQRWDSGTKSYKTYGYDSNGNPVYGNGKSMVFQFRLRNLGQTGGNPKRDFYIETQWSSGYEIGPDEAIFVNNHNGAPIISQLVKFPSGVTNNEGALGLNVVKEEDNYGQATASEAAQLSDAAKVISGVNQISILNAAGKTVTVTNVLGQTVAKTVATSDNATITLPKGIVVVSVDGKSTKAVVK
jgi:hypothetical protein